MTRIVLWAGLGLIGFPAWGQVVPTAPAAGVNSFSQRPRRVFDKTYWEWGGKARVSPQGYEVGVSRCTWRAFPGMVTLSLLNEFPRGVTWVNPKLSTEIAVAFVAVRLSAVDYTNWRGHDVRLRPEYGFSVLGFANVLYHRDLMLSAHRFDIAPQGWSVTFNFPSNPKNYTLF